MLYIYATSKGGKRNITVDYESALARAPFGPLVLIEIDRIMIYTLILKKIWAVRPC